MDIPVSPLSVGMYWILYIEVMGKCGRGTLGSDLQRKVVLFWFGDFACFLFFFIFVVIRFWLAFVFLN